MSFRRSALTIKLKRHYSGLLSLASRLSTIRASAVFAVSGAAFAVGNLLLARVMPVEEFGRFVLALALFNIFAVIAPVGLDQVMLRHFIGAGRRVLLLLVLAGSVIGCTVGLGASWLSGLPSGEGMMLAVSILAGGIIFAVVAGLRAASREAAALVAMTAASWLLLGIGLLALVVPFEAALTPLALYAGGEVLVAAIGWVVLLRSSSSNSGSAVPIPWSEAFSLLGVAAIGTIAVQLERLLVPLTLGVEPLALFSVLASVAIFPFRMVTAGAGFGLVPKLRATSDAQARRRLVVQDFASIGVLLTGASLGVILLAPYVTSLLTDGRYQIGTALVVSACLNGSAKVLQALPRSILTACGDAKDIALLNRLGWLGLAASTLCAFAGAHWGLTGLIYGVAAGSLVGSVPAVILARRRLG